MKKRWSFVILPLIACILEALPWGAVCNFAQQNEDGSIGSVRKLYAYFDLTPFGYANFAPLITALLTCVALALLVIYAATDIYRLARAARIVLYAGTAISLCPLLLGLRFYSVLGAIISLCLGVEVLVLHLACVPSSTPARPPRRWKLAFLHAPDEMERQHNARAQINAYYFLVVALLIWSLFQSITVYSGGSRLNLLPCLLLVGACLVQTFSRLILQRNAVRDDSDSFVTSPLIRIVLLAAVLFTVLVTLVAFLVVGGVRV